MAVAVEATSLDVQQARDSIYIQLHTHCTQLYDVEEVHGLADLLENQAQVIANQRAYIRFLNNIVHPK
jgi:hypothetical protein